MNFSRQPVRSPGEGHAFSLVEVLAAITIIGIVTFLAVPNIVQVRQDAEDNLARSRAETLNMAIAAYVQAVGTNTAQANWASAANDNARYLLISPYVAFAESSLSAFTPSGYTNTLPTTISPLTTKVRLSSARSTNISY